jgi:hypothetical protein
MDPVYYNELRDQLHITEVSPLIQDEKRLGGDSTQAAFGASVTAGS